VTCELAAERYAPASKIILMARGLTRLCRDQFESSSLPVVVRKMASVMLASMTAWFGSFETNNLMAEATLLDPRFKRSGFEDSTAAEQAVLNVTAAAASRNNSVTGTNAKRLRVLVCLYLVYTIERTSSKCRAACSLDGIPPPGLNVGLGLAHS